MKEEERRRWSEIVAMLSELKFQQITWGAHLNSLKTATFGEYNQKQLYALF